jgi:hypothetical protein
MIFQMVHAGVQQCNARDAVDVTAAVARRWRRNLLNVFRLGPDGGRIDMPLGAIFETRRIFETVQFGVHRRTFFLGDVVHREGREFVAVVRHGTESPGEEKVTSGGHSRSLPLAEREGYNRATAACALQARREDGDDTDLMYTISRAICQASFWAQATDFGDSRTRGGPDKEKSIRFSPFRWR